MRGGSGFQEPKYKQQIAWGGEIGDGDGCFPELESRRPVDGTAG
ncbi:MAG TPA: hypothetical protein VGS41_13940 [Chthonomonadales bacterium]|nr:hypothetical protein [Chthonomonadales bacterium]